MLADLIGLAVVGVTGSCILAAIVLVLLEWVRDERSPQPVLFVYSKDPFGTFVLSERVREYDLGGDDS